MVFSDIMFKSANDNYSTPKDVYNKLDKEFSFNFDPCPLNPNFEVDGLQIEWGSSTFCNPPYSKIKDWCKKAYEEYLLGKTIVLLIPSRTDTRYWHDYIMKATEIRFIKGRLKFGDAKNSAPFPSAIIVFKNGKNKDNRKKGFSFIDDETRKRIKDTCEFVKNPKIKKAFVIADKLLTNLATKKNKSRGC